MMEWLRMPQGASNSGPVFTRVMRGAFEHIPRERGSTFVDDLSVHGINFLEHMGTMQLVFDTLREINVKIKPSKTHCNYTEVRKLGHLVSAVGRRIDPERVRAILEMAQPQTIEQLESFLGMFPYNQEYLKGIYVTLRPLYDLKSKRSTGQWSEEHTEAFRQAKLILSNIPILLNPDTTKKFYIEVDACTRGGRGMGAVLKQKDDSGALRPVAYWSHALTDRERESYSASMAEARALHDSILFWGVYLRHGPAFEVACDHKALIYMLTTSVRTANRVVMRYILDLQEYNFSLHYCKGSLNIEADAVSRLLRYDDESIFFPKTADELRDDHGPVITKSEHYMAKQMLSDWLWLYPEVCWRDSFGQPLDPKTTVENLGITDDDLLPPIPRKQRGRPKRVQPTIDNIGPNILEQQLIKDTVSDIVTEMMTTVAQRERPVVLPNDELPFSIVPNEEFESTLKTFHVNMARRSERIQEQLDEDTGTFLKHPESHSSMTRAKAERTRSMLLGNRESHPEIEKWKWMLGRVYEDFDNHRLYEVIYIYYDNREQRVCGYSRSMDDAPADPQDVFPIFCEGPECLEEMVRAFESIHGPTGERIEWPATQEEFIQFQLRDPVLAKIVCDLEAQEDNDRASLMQGKLTYSFGPTENTLIDGPRLLVATPDRTNNTAPANGSDTPSPLPVVPDILQPLALRLYHDGLAHPGLHRSCQTIRINYIWEGMFEGMKKHIHECRYCGRRKVHTNKAKVPIQQYPIPPYPFWRCHIDITGPFVKSKAGNTHILVLKDALSKWVEIIAIPDTKAETVAEFLFSEIYCRYGSIEELVSDRGTEFINAIVIELQELLQIKSKVTTPYHPQANGMVENFMKTLKDGLQDFVNAAHDDWDEHLQVVAHCYRTTVHAATGFTPFYSLFGREAKSVSNSWVREYLQTRSLTTYVAKIVSTLQRHWLVLGEKAKKAQGKLNLRPAQPRIFKELKVGQMVYQKSIPKLKYKYYLDKKEYALSKKLQFRFRGPYIITRKLSPVVYQIQRENNKLKTVSIMNLKPA